MKMYCPNVRNIYLILANMIGSLLANMIKLENMLSIFLNLECDMHLLKLLKYKLLRQFKYDINFLKLLQCCRYLLRSRSGQPSCESLETEILF